MPPREKDFDCASSASGRRAPAPEDPGFDGEPIATIPLAVNLLLQRLETLLDQAFVLDVRQVR